MTAGYFSDLCDWLNGAHLIIGVHNRDEQQSPM